MKSQKSLSKSGAKLWEWSKVCYTISKTSMAGTAWPPMNMPTISGICQIYVSRQDTHWLNEPSSISLMSCMPRRKMWILTPMRQCMTHRLQTRVKTCQLQTHFTTVIRRLAKKSRRLWLRRVRPSKAARRGIWTRWSSTGLKSLWEVEIFRCYHRSG